MRRTLSSRRSRLRRWSTTPPPSTSPPSSAVGCSASSPHCRPSLADRRPRGVAPRRRGGVVAALAARGDGDGAQLSEDEPRLRTAVLPTTEKAYDVRRNVTTWVLTLMGAEGRIVRGRPRGGWLSRQHVWEPVEPVVARRHPGGARCQGRPGGGVPRPVRAGHRDRRRLVDRMGEGHHAQGTGVGRRGAGASSTAGARVGRRRRPRARRRRSPSRSRCSRRSTRRRWGGRSGPGSPPTT